MDVVQKYLRDCSENIIELSTEQISTDIFNFKIQNKKKNNRKHQLATLIIDHQKYERILKTTITPSFPLI